ncbi:MAG: hypothetical protein U0Q22_01890 [Acidimicrobiales bacterium]
MCAALVSMIAIDEGARLGSMFVFFLIALVIVAPFGWVRIRRVLRERRASSEPTTTGAEGVEDTPATTEPDPRDVVLAVDAIGAAATTLGADDAPDHVDVDVPLGALVGGRPAPDSLIDALLADTARRIGLRVAWVDGAEPEWRRARITRR